MKKMNKKGFTLVELLAVIVILALIMAIAVVSMSGIMTSARNSTFKETAVQIINGVQQQLTLANELLPGSEGFAGSSDTGRDYFFTKQIIEKGGDTSPLGGNIKYAAITDNSDTSTKAAWPKKAGSVLARKIGNMDIYRAKDGDNQCGQNKDSFVRVKYNGSNFQYSICLSTDAANKYIDVTNGTLEKLLDNNDLSMILPA